ncbi:DNA-methyltransferase [Lactobacillus jensenii]|uniref:DNA-methyltransferase n=2 Tax=Lactobacillus jensenii TaxID=109790 RepID=UPI0022434214|nr:site-specific DNA-methyltransferase [Lactobacillus jensenii]MCW8072248.1 site-specific DNA-methyltransferase [Lactobacillus jensenii]MDK8235005.1 site-specific DNA-methyltransferase [Lactobacillus jensenii]
MKLINQDCMIALKNIDSESVDFILADLPYGKTDNDWDKVIPLKALWAEYERVIKPNGAIALFGVGGFGVDLITSSPKSLPYRYEWIWQKTRPSGFLLSHKRPMMANENIYMFYKKQPTYNPQMRTGFKPYEKFGNTTSSNYKTKGNSKVGRKSNGDRFPINILQFSNANNHTIHPTQKPVDLLEYLIKTYTNPNEVVLDNTMGVGSTGVACVNTGRDFIGVEINEEYFKIAEERISNVSRA